MILLRIAMGAIYHDACDRTLLEDGSLVLGDVGSREVGSGGAATEDDVNVRIAACFDDGGETLRCYTHEGVWVGGGGHGVNCYSHTIKKRELILGSDGGKGGSPPVGAIFETNGEGNA